MFLSLEATTSEEGKPIYAGQKDYKKTHTAGTEKQKQSLCKCIIKKNIENKKNKKTEIKKLISSSYMVQILYWIVETGAYSFKFYII